MSEDIKVNFVIRKDCENENDCSEDMQLAFIACEQHTGAGLQAKWVPEEEIKKFDGLTKRDVFVLNEFAGELFEKLRATKCLLVGPRCISCCMTEGTPIPSGPEPVFTVAMRGLQVSASGLSKEQKERIKRRVHWMGGIYTSALTDDTTHLVSDTVLSDKYIKAVEQGIPIMAESWIDAVWDTSLHLNVNGGSSDFHKHKLPAFFNLQITTSGISKKDKQTIMKLVNEHGGTFSGAFQSETTDIVVLTKEGIGSEKYKAALEYGKACVLPSWVKESAARGVAVPLAHHRVASTTTSSPLAEHSKLPDMSLNFSRITNVRPMSNYVDETRSADVSTISGKMKLSQETRKSLESVDKDVQAAFDNFDMSLIKKAGPIFDGFCIWVTGPDGAWRERACSSVSKGGGVRYDQPHDRVSHIVCGNKHAGVMAGKQLPAVPALLATWLTDSLLAKRALDETEYIIDTKPSSPSRSGPKPRIEPSSPMSKRNLQLLRRGPLTLPPPEPVIEPIEDDVVNHYLSQKAIEPEREKTPPPVSRDTTEQPEVTDDLEDEASEVDIFKGITFEIVGLDDESMIEIESSIREAMGEIVNRNGSYKIMPLDPDTEDIGDTCVTVFWLKDCLSQQELVPVQYYHRPVRLRPWGPGQPPLHGVVASLSTYSGVERAFLDELAKLLGATTQLRFCRRTTPNSLASTHLLCPEPTGDKYTGALKWNLPAVRAGWLLECAKEGRRVKETDYLVGDTKAPPSPIQENKEEEQTDNQPEPLEVLVDKSINKENAMLPPAGRRGSESGSNTPRGKNTADVESMSPASRYIALARRGLLPGDSQETPPRARDGTKLESECDMRTPPLEDALSTPNLLGLSPTTRRRIQAVKRGEMPSDPIRTPNDPLSGCATPDASFGAALRPGAEPLSPHNRKRLWHLVQQLPTKHEPQPKDNHTPLSEIRNRFLAQFHGDSSTATTDNALAPRKLLLQDDTPPAKMAKFSVDQCPTTPRLPTTHNETTKQKLAKTIAFNQSASCSKSSKINESIHQTSANNISIEPSHTPNEPTNKPIEPPTNPIDPSNKPTEVGVQSERLSGVEAALQRLSAALSGRASSPAGRRRREEHRPVAESEPAVESQPNTVGWDDSAPAPLAAPDTPQKPFQNKLFMLSSNVDNREDIIRMIVDLGGAVWEGPEVTAEATHLLCALPSRSEKMLGAVAAGKWALHPLYVARCHERRAALPEAEYEWGNPQATCLPALSAAERTLAAAAHRWRSGRHGGGAGPFHGVAALVHAPAARRLLLARLVLAGGGRAPDYTPPYTNDDVTVCFADIKRCPLSERDANWLRSRKIPVCAPVLLSSYLTDESTPNPMDHCLPEFRP